MSQGPVGHSSFLHTHCFNQLLISYFQNEWYYLQDELFTFYLTNKVFHHLRVVSMKDGCSKPAQVELDISLSCFNVLLVADIHRLSPVSRQRDAN